MTGTEKNIYLYIMLFLLLVLMTGCAGQKGNRKDGSESLASLIALEETTQQSTQCLKDTQLMWNTFMSNQALKLPANASELMVGMLMLNQAWMARSMLPEMIGRCMAHIEAVATQYNLTDRDKMNMYRAIGTGAIVGGFAYLSVNSIANAFSQGMANAGGEYLIAGPGSRVVQQTDRDYVYDDGFEIFGSRENTQAPATTPAGQAPGAVSSSGNGDVIGNNMNFTITSGKSTGAANTNIPNFSNDPVTGGEASGESTIRANP